MCQRVKGAGRGTEGSRKYLLGCCLLALVNMNKSALMALIVLDPGPAQAHRNTFADLQVMDAKNIYHVHKA